ncbi:hypothetical protein [Kitasatospora aureofaciens]|uniref:hypothetical protein n=1 Tax=Kitasatospora aureofaciens TaxID=1894 RepID=UPI001C46A286|nr:hypothetical protein [Kitasatospora aureofaciens]MBV6699320.1 hypothetical protein [Kitasatospora aureofaciens]
MASIVLNHANIDEAADALTQAGQGMHTAMDNCMTAIKTAESQLSGDLATAANAFYQALANQNGAMNDDITNGADVLRTMHGLLRDADKRAAAGIG